MRVLVVDDEKLIRDVIKEYLLLENIEVEVVHLSDVRAQ